MLPKIFPGAHKVETVLRQVLILREDLGCSGRSYERQLT